MKSYEHTRNYSTKQEAQLLQRDSASVRTSVSARSLIVHFTEHRICCTTVYYIIDYLNSYRHNQLTYRATYVADEAFKHYNTFKVICFCITRKPLRAFKIIRIPNGHTSQDIWEMTMMHNVNNNQV